MLAQERNFGISLRYCFLCIVEENVLLRTRTKIEAHNQESLFKGEFRDHTLIIQFIHKYKQKLYQPSRREHSSRPIVKNRYFRF